MLHITLNCIVFVFNNTIHGTVLNISNWPLTTTTLQVYGSSSPLTFIIIIVIKLNLY